MSFYKLSKLKKKIIIQEKKKEKERSRKIYTSVDKMFL